MPSKKNKGCIICGEPAPLQEFPHGTIRLCPNKCFKMFCAISQQSVPIVWAGHDDFVEREIFSSEELEGQKEALVDAAECASDYLWDNGFGNTFDDAIRAGAIELERALIRNAPREKLPLFMGHLKFPRENESYLAEAIKKI